MQIQTQIQIQIQIQIHDSNLAAPGALVTAAPLPYLRSTPGQPAKIGRGDLFSFLQIQIHNTNTKYK